MAEFKGVGLRAIEYGTVNYGENKETLGTYDEWGIGSTIQLNQNPENTGGTELRKRNTQEGLTEGEGVEEDQVKEEEELMVEHHPNPILLFILAIVFSLTLISVGISALNIFQDPRKYRHDKLKTCLITSAGQLDQ